MVKKVPLEAKGRKRRQSTVDEVSNLEPKEPRLNIDARSRAPNIDDIFIDSSMSVSTSIPSRARSSSFQSILNALNPIDLSTKKRPVPGLVPITRTATATLKPNTTELPYSDVVQMILNRADGDVDEEMDKLQYSDSD